MIYSKDKTGFCNNLKKMNLKIKCYKNKIIIKHVDIEKNMHIVKRVKEATKKGNE